MNILIAPDSFKDCLSAKDVAEFLQRGLIKSSKNFKIRIVPMADGGEGTVESLVDATKGTYRNINVLDALKRERVAKYGILGDGKTAVIEMAQASGIEHLTLKERNPLITSTFGTGQLILDALNNSCKRIIIGIGGSATNDGGVGMAQALGISFKSGDKKEVSDGGGNLGLIEEIDISNLDPRIDSCEIVVACDVTNPLTGPNGASFVYGPQKGATSEMVEILDYNLNHIANLIKAQLNSDVSDMPGSGAAGGLGAGLMAFCGGKLRGGFDIVASETMLSENCQWADVIITGEGKIDFQTKFGKTPQGVANYAKKYNKPLIAVAGTLGDDYNTLYNSGFDAIFSIVDKPMELDSALKNAPTLLENIGETIGNILKIKTPDSDA